MKTILIAFACLAVIGGVFFYIYIVGLAKNPNGASYTAKGKVHDVIAKRDEASLRKILAAGGDPNEKELAYGYPPLRTAINERFFTAVGILLAAGADPNLGKSPLGGLFMAGAEEAPVRKELERVVLLYLQHGYRFGDHPEDLIEAVKYADKKIVSLLIEQGAPLDVTSTEDFTRGWTLFDLAHRPEIYELLPVTGRPEEVLVRAFMLKSYPKATYLLSREEIRKAVNLPAANGTTALVQFLAMIDSDLGSGQGWESYQGKGFWDVVEKLSAAKVDLNLRAKVPEFLRDERGGEEMSPHDIISRIPDEAFRKKLLAGLTLSSAKP